MNEFQFEAHAYSFNMYLRPSISTAIIKFSVKLIHSFHMPETFIVQFDSTIQSVLLRREAYVKRTFEV